MRWTKEAREIERQGMLANKPWEHPKTKEGKRRSSQNAVKHGARSYQFRLLESQLVEFAKLQEEIKALISGL